GLAQLVQKVHSAAGVSGVDENWHAAVDQRCQGARIIRMRHARDDQHDEVCPAHRFPDIAGQEIDWNKALYNAARFDAALRAQGREALWVARMQAYGIAALAKVGCRRA